MSEGPRSTTDAGLLHIQVAQTHSDKPNSNGRVYDCRVCTKAPDQTVSHVAGAVSGIEPLRLKGGEKYVVHMMDTKDLWERHLKRLYVARRSNYEAAKCALCVDNLPQGALSKYVLPNVKVVPSMIIEGEEVLVSPEEDMKQIILKGVFDDNVSLQGVKIKTKKCADCAGTGVYVGFNKREDCKTCRGSGLV